MYPGSTTGVGAGQRAGSGVLCVVARLSSGVRRHTRSRRLTPPRPRSYRRTILQT